MDGQHNDFSFYGFNIHSPKSTLVGTSAYGSQQENPLELEAKLPETAQKMEQMMPSIPRRRGSGKGNPQNPKILLMIMTNQDHPGIFI
ncbi:hypothetical protein C5167_030081 [Papaver somniferum]|nr:hypothetical protein C5167_030081 [Papaver somniferum]